MIREAFRTRSILASCGKTAWGHRSRGVPASIDPPSGRAGFTLVELLVALGLGAIISVIIAVVAKQTQDSYTTTVAKVEVYNRFRLAFNTLEQDLGGWIPSSELEFYNDGRGGRPRDFHWQPGEEVQDRKDAYGDGQVDGGVYGEFDEFPFIEERHYQSLEPGEIEVGDTTPNVHDAYRVYFRTMTYVEGAVREANVEYLLVDTNEPALGLNNPWGLPPGTPPPPQNYPPDKAKNLRNLALYKVVRYYEIDGSQITNLQEYPIKRSIVELATNVTDFRVEYFVQNPFNPRKKAGFRTPSEELADPIETSVAPERVKGPTGDLFRKTFGYGSMDLENRYPRGTAFTAAWGDNRLRSRQGHYPVRFGFRASPAVSFAELRTGDRIFVFTDSTLGASRVGAASLVQWRSDDYTIRSNLNGLLEFYEDIDASAWGDKDQQPINYKASILPMALRIMIRMIDDNGKNPKTMQQTIWLRRKSF